jgi:hypothetical protein
VNAQVENIIVEKYYVADSLDAADTTFGKLNPGAVTYRVYIDLAQGSALKKIYGDAHHALKFQSTGSFYNQTDRGEVFGANINNRRLNQSPLALDSWITIGQATNKHVGVLKTSDNDGSILAGIPQDTLLVNNDPATGIPLTTADGLLPIGKYYPITINSIGFSEFDSTIFDKNSKNPSFFYSNSAYLKDTTDISTNDTTNGVKGLTDENIILVAQLTTTGNLSLNLNIEVEENGKTIKYVSTKDTLLPNEIYSRFLNYPVPVQECGCGDPNYIEYKKNLDCTVKDSCKNLIVFGCMDKNACNYNPNANVNMLCCYPGQCQDRDITLVCPQIKRNREIASNDDIDFTLYPNPAQTQLVIHLEAETTNLPARYIVYNSFGSVVDQNELHFTTENLQQLDVSALPRGLYYIKLMVGDYYSTARFLLN